MPIINQTFVAKSNISNEDFEVIVGNLPSCEAQPELDELLLSHFNIKFLWTEPRSRSNFDRK